MGSDLTEIDIRLLRVFRAVVEAGGFSHAQAALNLNPSTISTQMAALEERLGYVVCRRGRGGFKLTEQGESLYRHVLELFKSLHSFQVQVSELNHGLNGHLRIGFLDNVIGDPDSPLQRAIRLFACQGENNVQLSLEVMAPRELERELLSERIDVAVGIFFDELPGLDYQHLYRERDVLVCHRDHALVGISDMGELARALPSVPKVVRTFMGDREFPSRTRDRELIGRVANVEAAAMLILSGQYIGFLPYHFARPWIERGELRVLLPEKISRHSQFKLVTRSNAEQESQALRTFLRCVGEVR